MRKVEPADSCSNRVVHGDVYSGSRFFSVFNSGPTFLRLYVTLYSTVCFFPGFRSMKYLTCCRSTRSTRPAIVCRST